MRFDGGVLPNLSETVVLHDLGLVRSDDLPGIAARWLASDLVDTEAVRMLAGHDPHDVWMVEKLLRDALIEADAVVPSDPSAVQRVAVDWVAETWRASGETRWAVATLSRLGETHFDFDLGLFISLDDELSGGGGGSRTDLMKEATTALEALLHGSPGSS